MSVSEPRIGRCGWFRAMPRNGARVPSSAPPLRPLSHTAPKPKPRRSSPVGRSTMVRREPNGPAGFGSKVDVAGCRRKMIYQFPAPAGCGRGGDHRPLQRLAGENRQLLEASTAPAATAERRSNAADVAAFQMPQWTFAGRRRTRFRSGTVEDPRVSIPVPASIKAAIRGQSWPRSSCEWSQQAPWPSGRVRHE